jgi:hypothetical protein
MTAGFGWELIPLTAFWTLLPPYCLSLYVVSYLIFPPSWRNRALKALTTAVK